MRSSLVVARLAICVIGAAALGGFSTAACLSDAPAPLTNDNGDGSIAGGEGGPGSEGGPGNGDAAGEGGPGSIEWTLALTSRTRLFASAVEPATGDVYAGGAVIGGAAELGIADDTKTTARPLLLKISGATGKVVWAKTFASDFDAQFSSMTLNAGTLYVTGTLVGAGTITFPGASPGATLTFATGKFTGPSLTQSFVARIDASSGAPMWAMTPDASALPTEAHRSLCGAVAFAGTPVVACAYAGTTFGGNGVTAPPITSGNFAVALLAIASTGNVASVRSLHSSTQALPSALVADATSIHVAGNCGPDLIPDNDTASLISGSGGTLNGFVATYPVTGAVKPIVTAFTGGSDNTTFALPSGLALSGDKLIVTGRYAGNVGFGGIIPSAGAGGSDTFLAWVNPSIASVMSVLRYGGTLEDGDYASVATTAAGRIFWAASFLSTDFKLAGTTLPTGAAGGSQSFLSEMDTVGPKGQGATTFTSSTGNLNITKVAVDDTNGFVVATGFYNGSATFGTTTTSTSVAQQAGFVLRRKL